MHAEYFFPSKYTPLYEKHSILARQEKGHVVCTSVQCYSPMNEKVESARLSVWQASYTAGPAVLSAEEELFYCFQQLPGPILVKQTQESIQPLK